MVIQVTLQDYTGTQRQVKLNASARVADLIRAITSAMQLPVMDEEGQEISYYLRYGGEDLKDDETLEAQNIQENDVITIMPFLRYPPYIERNISQKTSLRQIIVSSPERVPERILLNSEATVKQLIPAITSNLRLPVVDEEGRAIEHRLYYNNRLLRENETLQDLEDLGFTNNDVLVLEPQLPTTTIDDFPLISGGMGAKDGLPLFLISYHYHDFSWADWLSREIQEHQGCMIRLFDCDTREGEKFPNKMHDALTTAEAAERVVAVISRTYLKSRFAQAQLSVVEDRDPSGTQKLLLPVYIEDCSEDLSGA